MNRHAVWSIAMAIGCTLSFFLGHTRGLLDARKMVVSAAQTFEFSRGVNDALDAVLPHVQARLNGDTSKSWEDVQFMVVTQLNAAHRGYLPAGYKSPAILHRPATNLPHIGPVQP